MQVYWWTRGHSWMRHRLHSCQKVCCVRQCCESQLSKCIIKWPPLPLMSWSGACTVWYRLHLPTQHPPLCYFSAANPNVPDAHRLVLSECTSPMWLTHVMPWGDDLFYHLMRAHPCCLDPGFSRPLQQAEFVWFDLIWFPCVSEW